MGPKQVRCKAFQCDSTGKKSEAIEGTHVRMAAIPSENGDFVRWRLGSVEVNQHERYDGFADTQALKVFPTSVARALSQRHTEHGHRKDYCNHGRYYSVFPHRHG